MANRKNVPSASGGRVALLNHIDSLRADQDAKKAHFRVDLQIERSPKKKVIAAGIVVYRTFSRGDEEYEEAKASGVEAEDGDLSARIHQELVRDPEKTKRAGIVDRFLRVILESGGKAEARVICAGLGITRHWSLDEVSHHSKLAEEAHRITKDIYDLFEKDYEWNPRDQEINRLRGRKPFQTPITVGASPKTSEPAASDPPPQKP